MHLLVHGLLRLSLPVLPVLPAVPPNLPARCRALALAGFKDIRSTSGEVAVAHGLHRIWKAIP